MQITSDDGPLVNTGVIDISGGSIAGAANASLMAFGAWPGLTAKVVEPVPPEGTVTVRGLAPLTAQFAGTSDSDTV